MPTSIVRERLHTVGRETKKERRGKRKRKRKIKPTVKNTLQWLGFEPTDSVYRSEHFNHNTMVFSILMLTFTFK